MKSMTVRAYAKINLALEVLGRRPDGYHEVRSVLQTVILSDELTFQPGEEITLRCDLPELGTPENLVMQAAYQLREESGVEQGAAIELAKGIPVAAGLGGGSADAAATLLALDRFWGLELPQGRLQSIAADLGADVPFFLLGGTALVWGTGAEFMPLPDLPETWLVLLYSQVEMPGKTAVLYSRLADRHFSSGDTVEALAQEIRKGRGLSPALMINSFEEVAYETFPDLAVHQETLLEAGAASVHLTGTGPTLYAPVTDQQAGAALEGRLRTQGLDARLVHTVRG